MAQEGNGLNTDEDVAMRSDGSQFRNGYDRLQSVLIRTGGVIPGSEPKMGEKSFVRDRISKFAQPESPRVHSEGSASPLTGGSYDDNQVRNRAQLERLKRQLAEERNQEEGGSTLSSKGAGLAKSPPPTRTEAQANLLGIIEVRTPLQNISMKQKWKLALMSVVAVVNATPNISEDGLELGPIITTKKNVSVVMEGQTVSIMVANATGGGVHEMARHLIAHVGVVVKTSHNKVLVYIGRDAMGRRTAVVLELPGEAECANLAAHFKLYRKSQE